MSAPDDDTSDEAEPNVVTRTRNYLGRTPHAPTTAYGYLDGTIAYVRMWHGVELTGKDATDLYNSREIISTFSPTRVPTTSSAPTPSSAPTTSPTTSPTLNPTTPAPTIDLCDGQSKDGSSVR